MADSDRVVVCRDCDEQPRLIETPYRPTDYVLVCDCDHRSLDVSDCANGSSLLEPLTGRWSQLDDEEKPGLSYD